MNYAGATTSTSPARMRPRARTVIHQQNAGKLDLASRLQQLLPAQRPSLPEACFLLVVLASLLLVTFTFRDYGFTHDEIFGYRRALNIYKYLASFGADISGVSEFTLVSFYGAMPDVLGMILQNMFPSLGLDARHLVSGLFGTVAIYYAGRIARMTAGPRTGALAALLLLLCTFWTGYSFINLKDIPFAACLLGALYSAMRVLDSESRKLWPSYLMLAFWGGALATCKLTGILILGVFILVMYGSAAAEGRWLPLPTLAKRVAVAALSGLAGIAVFSVVFWPQIYIFTPSQLYEVVTSFISFPGWQSTVLLAGRSYGHDEIPRSYLITYLVIGIPLALWFLYLAGTALAVNNRDWRVLGIALLAPLMLLIQFATQSLVYNGARHLLFVVPFLMIAAAYGITRLSMLGTLGKSAAVVLGLSYAAASIYNTVTLYPYQYSAYNMLVGGLSGAQNRYYVDVWKSAHREALLSIPPSLSGNPITVFSCGSILTYAGMPDIRPVRRPENAQYVVALPRGCPPSDFVNFRPIHEI
ncbi:MAG: glycosyltransferase family 39 protein, partial [Aestuariivirga sp.]|nr:glycosyltransferase family 39 protein [Aestuariivirga sp.]